MSPGNPALPADFVHLVSPLLLSELGDFLDAMAGTPWRALRLSARRAAPDLPCCGSPVPWAQNACYITDGAQPGAHPLHWAGAFYIQEPSAMAAASALRPKPGERVLDLCAAPGGKACQLADMMAGQGLLVANDPVPARAAELGRNLERLGVTHALALCAQPRQLAGAFPEAFDKVLVDAPCSGEGMFRKSPDSLARWSLELTRSCATLQSHILSQAAILLRPGGIMAYSTCTFNRDENEGVVEAFLLAHPGFELLPFTLPGLPAADTGMLRLWPHRVRGEGHFIALLRKNGADGAERRPLPPPLPAGRVERAIMDAVGGALPGWVRTAVLPDAVLNGIAVTSPEGCPDLRGFRVLRQGLHLGGVKGKTPLPDHALALAAQPLHQFPVSLEQAERFRRGEEIPAPGLAGFCSPALEGWPLGWGKASGGILKNHYPKGLRRQLASEG